MVLILDAFNLIYKFPDLEEKMYRGELKEAQTGLLQKLYDFRSRWKKPLVIHVFVDGKKKSGDETKRETVSEMNLYYSHDVSADHLIREFIKRYPSPGELYIVTSDKEIRFFAKKHKCHLYTSEEFAKLMNDTTVSPKASSREESDKPDMDADELSFWQEMFRKKR